MNWGGIQLKGAKMATAGSSRECAGSSWEQTPPKGNLSRGYQIISQMVMGEFFRGQWFACSRLPPRSNARIRRQTGPGFCTTPHFEARWTGYL